MAYTHHGIIPAPSNLPGLTLDEAAYISGLLASVASLPKRAPIARSVPVPPTLAGFAERLSLFLPSE